MLGRTGRAHPQQAIAPVRLIWLLLLAAAPAGAEEAAEPVPSMRLRLEWGSGERKAWAGEVRVSQGRVLEPQALDIEADTPGTLRLSGDRLLIRQRTQRAYAGVDVTVQAPLEAILTIDLQSVDGKSAAPQAAPNPHTIEVPLRHLLHEQTRRPLDTERNELLVYRLSSDALRVELDHAHMIFEPGQVVSGRVSVPLLEGLSRDATVVWELRRARASDALAQGELGRVGAGATGTVQFPLEIRVPQEEGVYSLHLAVIAQGRFRQPRVHEREVQFVVLAARASASRGGAPLSEPDAATDGRRLVDEIDPTVSRFDPTVSRFLPGRTIWRAPLVVSQVRKTPAADYLEIHRRSESPVESWVAYRLRIKHPGRPHLLEVAYPADREQSLAISIVEPNPAGRVWPVGQDSGVYTGDPGELREGVGEHELLFWPRTTAPLLLLTNLRRDRPAAFGKMRIYEVRDGALPGSVASTARPKQGFGDALRRATNQAIQLVGQPGETTGWSASGANDGAVQANPQSPDEPRDAVDVEVPTPPAPAGVDSVDESASLVPAAPAEPEPLQREPTQDIAALAPSSPAATQRLFGPYMHKPLFPENFGASEQLERASQRSLDDWQTFWEGAHRLVAYLKRRGYNSMMLAVLADGSTIYPSALLEPTPRYDMGVFFPDGRDPMRKDVLELLFRLFDREGLVLVAELQFTAPLPELERMLAEQARGSDRLDGVRLVGGDGRTWLERFGSFRGSAPYYNPLDPRVQEGMLRVVEELTDRYGEHPSFGGLALQLSADGYAQFPGLDWGYDGGTIARFAAESQTSLPEPAGRVDRTAHYQRILTQQARKEWLSWRAKELAEFYQRVAQRVCRRHSARLYLTTTHALAGSVGARAAYSALQEGRAVEELLLERGIDRQMIAGGKQIVWLRPSRVGTLEHLRGGALDADMSNSPELDALFRTSPVPGTLFFHRPYTQRLPSFEKAGLPWKDTYMQLVAQLSPSGVDNRRRFAHALAGMDAQVLWDGGWLIPLGQEQALKGWIDAFRRLPPRVFATVEPENAAQSTQPVTVRRYAAAERTYLYLVNDSAWTVSSSVLVHCAPDTELDEAGADYSLRLQPAGSGVSRLECRLGAYGVCVVALPVRNLKVSNPVVEVPPAVASSLEAEIASLNRRLDGGYPGAEESQRLAASLRNASFEQAEADDPMLPQDWTFAPVDRFGRAALDPDRPHEGRWSLRCSSRGTLSSAAFEAPRRPFLGLRVRLRSDRDGVRVRLALEGTMARGTYVRTSVPILVGRDWHPYMFRVFDLPHPQIQELRARLEALQDATVWVDAVELVSFPLKEREELELGKAVSNARLAYQNGKLSDCRRLLDSYWARFVKEQLPDPAEAEEDAAVLTRRPQLHR